MQQILLLSKMKLFLRKSVTLLNLWLSKSRDVTMNYSSSSLMNSNYSNTLCGTVVVYFGCQNILLAILVIGMFSTVWWNIFEFSFMSGGIFSTGKNGVENFLSKILVSKIFHRWLSNIFHCWWIHLSKIFCRKLYVFPSLLCKTEMTFWIIETFKVYIVCGHFVQEPK